MIVGIDLGTTNSLAAVWRDGASVLVPNGLGEYLTPSCVSIDEDDSVLVGKAARERLQTHPERTAAVFKRYMGSNKTMRLGKREFRPEELSALVLRSLKADAEAMLGEPVTEAVITVPAYFSDAQRKATRAAGELAGLKVERLLNEPTAAALAYGMHDMRAETRFLVFDLGGGTFDVSILEMFEGVMEVRATAGDNFLGGEDFVNEIVQLFFAETGLPEAARADGGFMQQLVARAERAKRALSDSESTTLTLHWQDREHTLALTQERFRAISEPLLARLRGPVERALRDASIRAGDIDNVVLAGGATRSPVVRQMVTRMFGRFPAMDINPDEVVALGAAVMAGLKARDEALKEVVMTDVAPYSLGVAVSRWLSDTTVTHGHFDPIIERNSTVPVSRSKSYVPNSGSQTSVDLHVFQGESRMVRDNVHLGTLHVPLPSLGAGASPGDAAVEVRFTYDVNGLLQVEATVQKTQETFSLLIEGNPGLLSEAEIKERLAALSALKIHPRDRIENRTLLARAERIYQQLRGDVREWLGIRIAEFERVLALQDKRQIAAMQRQFQEQLEQIERDGPLAD